MTLVSFSGMHAGATHALEFFGTVLNEVSSLLVAVHGLPAECGFVIVDLALYLAVGGLCLGLVELSALVLLSSCRLEICNIVPGDCAAVCSRFASLHPAIELRSARGRASVSSGPSCEFSSGSFVLTFSLVL